MKGLYAMRKSVDKILSILKVVIATIGYIIAFRYIGKGNLFLKILIIGCVGIMFADLFGKGKTKGKAVAEEGCNIDTLNKEDFKIIIQNYFAHFKCKMYTKPLDEGYTVDLLFKKGNEVLAVGLRHFKNPIKNGAVRYSEITDREVYSLISSMKHYETRQGLMISNIYFSDKAKELAERYHVILWDRDKIKKLLSEVDVDTKTLMVNFRED